MATTIGPRTSASYKAIQTTMSFRDNLRSQAIMFYHGRLMISYEGQLELAVSFNKNGVIRHSVVKLAK